MGPANRVIAIVSCALACVSCVGKSGATALASPQDRYLLSEEGSVYELQAITVLWSEWNAMQDVFLVEEAPTDTAAVNRLIRSAKPWRRNSGLFQLADWLTSDVPRDRMRWIIGTHPTIIAISAQPDAPDPRKRTSITPLVTDADADRVLVNRLMIQDRWIEHKGWGPAPAITPPPPSRRVIDLPEAMTIRQVLEQAPWR